MARTKKVYCLKKKGDYYYYKFPEMKTFRTTGLKSEDKAQKFVIALLEQKNKENGIFTETTKNDAYIPISAEMVRRYPNLFPVKQSAPTSWEGVVRRDHRDNDCIDIIWDDGTTMTGLLEGSRSVAGLEGKYPKQISSSPSKSDMGKYLRRRLGLPEGSVVRMIDFNRYIEQPRTMTLVITQQIILGQ